MSGLKIFMIGFCGLLCLLILSPPFLATHSYSASAALIYLLFSPICHQLPERSFHFFGYPLAVCHRCTGIYFGLFLGMLLPAGKSPQFGSPLSRRLFVFCICIPMLLDVSLPSLGIWNGTPLTRFATGLIFGSSSAFLLALAFSEFTAENSLNSFLSHCAQSKGANL